MWKEREVERQQERNEDRGERCLYCSTVGDGRMEAVEVSGLVRNMGSKRG